MNAVAWIAVGFGVLGVLFGLRCYLELWRWAKQCQRAQIVLAYNNKVRFRATLVEWLQWVNSLDGTEENGRVVYQQFKFRAAIVKKGVEAKTASETVQDIRNSRRSRKGKVAA